MRTETEIENEARPGRGPYRRRSFAEKRKIVEQCLRPGASVAGVALAHGVNANLVRKWIAKYRAGEWGESGAPLLPVAVRREMPPLRLPAAETPAKGHIEIELASGRLRVVGRIDAETLNIVLGALR
jgi:transposase